MAEDISYGKLIPAFHFEVTFITKGTKVKNEPSITFSEVSGIGIELQTEDIMEGGGNNYVIRLPKPPKFKNLVLNAPCRPPRPASSNGRETRWRSSNSRRSPWSSPSRTTAIRM